MLNVDMSISVFIIRCMTKMVRCNKDSTLTLSIVRGIEDMLELVS